MTSKPESNSTFRLFLADTLKNLFQTVSLIKRMFVIPVREGHMPGILTMIQVDRSTPAPSVIIVTLLALLYLTSRYRSSPAPSVIIVTLLACSAT